MSEFIAALPQAAAYTLLVTACSFLIGAILAIPIMLARISKSIVLSAAARVVIDIVRGVPPLLWLFFIFFGISFGDRHFGAIQTAIIALGLISSAYLAEVYRGGYKAIAIGQFEAASALGMSRRLVAYKVIAPQAVRVAVPSMTTYAIGLLKDSSIASIIGVADIVFVTNTEARASGALLPFAVAAGLYLALSAPLALLSRMFDHRLRERVSR